MIRLWEHACMYAMGLVFPKWKVSLLFLRSDIIFDLVYKTSSIAKEFPQRICACPFLSYAYCLYYACYDQKVSSTGLVTADLFLWTRTRSSAFWLKAITMSFMGFCFTFFYALSLLSVLEKSPTQSQVLLKAQLITQQKRVRILLSPTEQRTLD